MGQRTGKSGTWGWVFAPLQTLEHAELDVIGEAGPADARQKATVENYVTLPGEHWAGAGWEESEGERGRRALTRQPRRKGEEDGRSVRQATADCL